MSMSRMALDQQEADENTTSDLNILVIDDDPDASGLYKHCLESDQHQDYNVCVTEYGFKGVKLCSSQIYDCVLLDYELPDITGIEFLHSIKNKTKNKFPIIMISGSADKTVVANALNNGAIDFLPKQEVSPEMLNEAIENAIEKFKLLNN